MTTAEIASIERIESLFSTYVAKSNATISEFKDRLFQMEQASARPGNIATAFGKSVGSSITESEQFKNFAGGARTSGRIPVGSFTKTALVSSTGVGQPLVAPQFYPGVTFPGQVRLTVRDLLPTAPTSSNMIEYTNESSFTNNAAVVGAGTSPLQFENVLKAESAAAFNLLYAPVQTIAHWIPVSKQLMDDSGALRGYIDARLMYGLKLAEEYQLLNGSGIGASLKGLVTSATAYDVSKNVAGDTKIDTLRRAIAQVRLTNYDVDAILVHPLDLEAIELIKTVGTSSSGQYIVADPRTLNPKQLWGKTVIDTISVPQGTFLVGAFAIAALLWDRQEAVVELSREHSDFFVRNMIAVLCEERLALTVFRPDALVVGTFPS